MNLKACQAAGSTRGSKLSFIMHILGGQGVKVCLHASDAAKQEVWAHKCWTKLKCTEVVEAGSAEDIPRRDMPFSQEETALVQAQVLWAVVSANLPLVLDEEAALMEALADQEEDEYPDDGAMEGSGDDYK